MAYTNYLYNRELYSNAYYVRKGIIIIKPENETFHYLYFDSEKHIKFTKNIKHATLFSCKPKNYDKYCEYIKRCFKNCQIKYHEDVILKSKY